MRERSPGINAKTIISLVGRQGSGKSTIGSKLAEYLQTKHIEASAVVREVCGDLPRSEMPLTNERTKVEPSWLSDAIQDRFPDDNVVVVTGIREPVVHAQFERQLYNLISFETRCDAEIRFQRQLKLGKCKNAKEFIEHELNEMALGVITLEFLAPFTIPTSDATDPDKIVRAMVKALVKEGVPLK